jgi:hypothetical protein
MSKFVVGGSLFMVDTVISGWALSGNATWHAVAGALVLTALGSIPMASRWASTLLEGES